MAALPDPLPPGSTAVEPLFALLSPVLVGRLWVDIPGVINEASRRPGWVVEPNTVLGGQATLWPTVLPSLRDAVMMSFRPTVLASEQRLMRLGLPSAAIVLQFDEPDLIPPSTNGSAGVSSSATTGASAGGSTNPG